MLDLFDVVLVAQRARGTVYLLQRGMVLIGNGHDLDGTSTRIECSVARLEWNEFEVQLETMFFSLLLVL